MATSSKIRTFLLDDHEMVRQGIRAMLAGTEDIEVVGESGSAREATRLIPAHRPDVAILDARLPDGSGVEVCRAVRATDPTIRVLILTSFGEDKDAMFAAIQAGAAGYLLKDVNGLDLVSAVRAVAAGESLIDPALTSAVLDRLRSQADQPATPAALTQQETRVLALIAAGLTNREIGEQLFLSEKTVKGYVSSLLAKMGVKSRTRAAVLASEYLQE